jgi:hypothetical protein
MLRPPPLPFIHSHLGATRSGDAHKAWGGVNAPPYILLYTTYSTTTQYVTAAARQKSYDFFFTHDAPSGE